MNAKEFYEQYTSAIYLDERTESLYYESDNLLKKNKGETPWTKFVNREIVPKIIRENLIKLENQQSYNGPFSYNEYFKIDVTGWTYHDKDSDIKDLEKEYNTLGINFYAWKMEIAFEHENDFQDWTYEVLKLLSIKCPLRVVVGYCRYTDRTNDQNKLSALVRLIEKIGLKENLSGEFLIILGNSGGETTKAEKMIDYKGYNIYLENDKVTFKQL